MAFGDVSTPNGMKELNNHLANNSYISGYEPSKSDVEVFEAVGKTSLSDYPHVARWYRHIGSFGANENCHWPAGKCVPLQADGKPTATAAANNDGGNDDDDVDLFGSDDEEEDAAAAKLREERLAAYAAKKSKKPAIIAKSSVVLDVKPWDDETDMKEMERLVRTIEMDGLLWGQSKLAPVGYGIHKLVIMCVIEDEKVSTDLLQEKITEFEDYVQSVDIASFNKI